MDNKQLALMTLRVSRLGYAPREMDAILESAVLELLKVCAKQHRFDDALCEGGRATLSMPGVDDYALLDAVLDIVGVPRQFSRDGYWDLFHECARRRGKLSMRVYLDILRGYYAFPLGGDAEIVKTLKSIFLEATENMKRRQQL